MAEPGPVDEIYNEKDAKSEPLKNWTDLYKGCSSWQCLRLVDEGV